MNTTPPPLFQEFQQRLQDLFRASPAADLERNVKALMTQTFNRMELVTRDELDIQAALLDELRLRVDALEARLALTEARTDKPAPAAADPLAPQPPTL